MRASKRISKEREKFEADPDIFTLAVDESEPHTWLLSFSGAQGTLFAGE
jgi:ubiquitin-protein ligase